MRRFGHLALIPGLLLASALPLQALAAPPAAVRIVAAENFYGDIARQLAGPGATVTSILSNPDEDPHLFEASPSVARALAGATLVIVNGADYDPWMDKLLAASTAPGRQTVTVASLMHRQAGDNPHLWYDPATMPVVARAIAAALVAAEPDQAAAVQARLQRMEASFGAIASRVSALRVKYAGLPVTATEPVFGYMATALGLTMRNERFQLAVMNNTEPSPSDTAAFEDDLRHHAVRLLITNSQASDSAATRLMAIAAQNNVPTIAVSETEPRGKDYQSWMMGQLEALDHALASRPAT